MTIFRLFWLALLLALPSLAHAAEADLYCLTGTSSTGSPIFVPASNANPCPVTGPGGGPVIVQGNVSNATSGVATTSTNVPTVAYNYGFNGTTWDQLQVDASKFLKVVLQAGSAIIGKVGIDQTTPGTTNGVVNTPFAATPTVSPANTATSLVLKASPSTVGVQSFHAETTGSAAGFCVLYNGTAAPGTGALTAANVLAFQSFPSNGWCDWTATSNAITASIGAVVLVTSAATPFTYTTGVVTAAIYGVAP